MAKTAVGQWDTTAANNTDINSIGIQGTNLVSNFDNALRELMSQVRTFQTSGYFGQATSAFSFNGNSDALQLVGVSSVSNATGRLGIAMFSATASAGPAIDFYRSKDAAINTATVVASGDRLFTINAYGAQQTGTLATQFAAVQILGEVDGTVTSGAGGDMPGRLVFKTTPDGSGTPAEVLRLDSTGLATVTGGQSTPLSVAWVDAGAAIGPTIDLFRDSASPAVSDILGSVDFNGRDSAANKQLYARIYSVINDPVSGTEDVSLRLAAVTAGTLVDIVSFTGASITMTGSVADKTWNMAADTDSISLYGGNSSSAGGMAQFYGSTHATQANNIKMRSNNTVRYTWDNSAAQHQWVGNATMDSDLRIGQNSTSIPGAGNNTIGACISSGGVIYGSAAAQHLLNRTTDASVLSFASGGTVQGSISIAGATTTYGAFLGSHWAQLADGSKPDIFRGTICDSIDEMCAWPGESDEDRLPRFKINDEERSRAVYGVFLWWDVHEDAEGRPLEIQPTNDAYIAAIGAGWIRIAKGVTVSRGDYIESDGAGCGRVQADDILRSSTVGKVSSTTVVETYPDGSYLIPCTLHCG